MSYAEVSRRHSTLHIMEREHNILISLRTALAVMADGLSAWHLLSFVFTVDVRRRGILVMPAVAVYPWTACISLPSPAAKAGRVFYLPSCVHRILVVATYYCVLCRLQLAGPADRTALTAESGVEFWVIILLLFPLWDLLGLCVENRSWYWRSPRVKTRRTTKLRYLIIRVLI